MLEAAVKRMMVKEIKGDGGYARRIEDQYGVGILDLVLIPQGGPVFFAEAKVFTGNVFGPTPRQFIEMQRIAQAAATTGDLHAVAVIVGWKAGKYYVAGAIEQVNAADLIPFDHVLPALEEYYRSVR